MKTTMEKVKIEEWESYCPECSGKGKIYLNDPGYTGWPLICPQCFGKGKFTWTECAKGNGIDLPVGEIVGNIKKESKGKWSYIAEMGSFDIL